MFNVNAFQTRQYEVASISAMGTLVPGTAVKLPDSLPTGLSPPASYFTFAPAGTADRPVGVVSLAGNITTTIPGRVCLSGGSPLVPALLDSAVTKGDALAIKTADGKWGKAGAGETPYLIAAEAGAAGDLVWASVL